MDSSYGHRVSLKQYRRLDEKWQFVPVVKQDGKPNPKLILINGEAVSSKGGVFYHDRHKGAKRRARPAPHRARPSVPGSSKAGFWPG